MLDQVTDRPKFGVSHVVLIEFFSSLIYIIPYQANSLLLEYVEKIKSNDIMFFAEMMPYRYTSFLAIC